MFDVMCRLSVRGNIDNCEDDLAQIGGFGSDRHDRVVELIHWRLRSEILNDRLEASSIVRRAVTSNAHRSPKLARRQPVGL